MALDLALRKQLRQTIYVAHKTTSTAAGVASYGTPTAVSARVVQKAKVVPTQYGATVTTTHQIVTTTEILRSDLIWLPGLSSADATLAREPQEIEIGVDEIGIAQHYMVLL